MTSNRLKVLKYWLFKNRNNVRLPELINFFFDKSYHSKAKALIKEIILTSDYYIIYFNKFKEPLYYPIDFTMKSLEQVIVETFYPDNWRYYEIEQTKVHNDDIVLDCGAAEGLFSLSVSNKCKQVFAIEPLNKFVASMRLTFKNIYNVEIIEKAIAEKNDRLFISNQDISSFLNKENIGEEVEVTTLDNLFLKQNIPISYIKVDLEGFDYLALLGATKLIEKYLPKIAVTTYHNVNHAKQIKELLIRINPNYKILLKGIYQETGSPVMLHAGV